MPKECTSVKKCLLLSIYVGEGDLHLPVNLNFKVAQIQSESETEIEEWQCVATMSLLKGFFKPFGVKREVLFAKLKKALWKVGLHVPCTVI